MSIYMLLTCKLEFKNVRKFCCFGFVLPAADVDFDIRFDGAFKLFCLVSRVYSVWLCVAQVRYGCLLPLSRMANRIVGASKNGGGRGAEQAYVLSGLGTLFERE